MAKSYSTIEVLDMVLDEPGNECDSEEEFEGYLDDEMVTETQHDDGNERNDEGILENDPVEDDVYTPHDTVLPEFVGSPACSVNMTNKNPIDFFELIVTDDVLQHTVVQTNLYANQYLEENEIPQRSRLRSWRKKVHTVTELIQFLCLLIVMGIINYPKTEDHWITSWPFCSSSCSQIMSRDRFSMLLRFFHLNDNKMYIKKGDPGYDPLYKLRPLQDSLLKNFKLVYNLGKQVSLDESMISFKGRLWFLQYMPKKPNKWGMKAFVLADANTGYTYNWKLYTGMLHE